MKYLWSTTLGCKDIPIRIFVFVLRTLIILLMLVGLFGAWLNYQKDGSTRAEATKEILKRVVTVAIWTFVIVVFFVGLGLLFK